MQKSIALVALAALCVCWIGADRGAAAELRCGLDSADQVARCGGKLAGEVRFVEGRTGKAARLVDGAAIRFPTVGHFNPREGSFDLWVRPRWSGEDGMEHGLVHMQSGPMHLTLFKRAGGSLQLTYRGQEDSWVGVSTAAGHWRPGQWYHVTASWQPVGPMGLMLCLRADDAQQNAMGAVPFDEPPGELWLGSRGPRRDPADADIDDFLLSEHALLKSPFPLGQKPEVTAVIDTAGDAGPWRPVHDFTTPWNARDVPMPFSPDGDYFRRYQQARFGLVRLVAFSDTWLWGVKVDRDAAGKMTLDFTDFDRLADMFGSAGSQVYLRLAYNVPRALSADGGTSAGRGHAYHPPRDLEEWDELMRAIVRHCNVERKLGIRYFVASLNEGDIPVRRGECDWRMVCELYERTVKAIHEVDPQAKVGGPALAADPRDVGKPLMREFVRFCAERKLPLDFICFHGYRKLHPADYEQMLKVVREIVAEEYPGLQPEYFLDEFNLWRTDRYQDNEYAAAYIAAAEHYLRRSGINKVSLVSFNHFLPASTPPKVLLSSKGPFDKGEGQTARFLPGEYTADGVQKQGILAHPPSISIGRRDERYTFGRYRLRVPAAKDRPRLTLFTGLGIRPIPRMDGVTFRVMVDAGDGPAKTLFNMHQREPAWQPREVNLAEYAGREIDLELRTLAGPPGSTTIADWGVWGEPRVVTGPKQQPVVVLDLVAAADKAQCGVVDAGNRFVYDEAAIRRYMGLPMLKGPVVTSPYFVLLQQNLLAGQRLPVTVAGDDGILPDGTAGVLAAGDKQRQAVLVWNFDLGSDKPRKFDLTLRGLSPGATLKLKQYLIDSTHTNPYYDYVIAGKDDNDGRYNIDSGKLDVVRDQPVEVGADGRVHVELSLEPTAVTVVELER